MIIETKTDCCPCCYQHLPDIDDVVVSLDENLLMTQGIKVEFTASEAECLHILLEKSPRWVDTGYILDGLYGMMDNQPDDKIVSVYLSKSRGKLRRGGIDNIRIESAWSHGGGKHKYRMVIGAKGEGFIG